MSPDSGFNELHGLSPEEQERQRQEWQQELAKVYILYLVTSCCCGGGGGGGGRLRRRLCSFLVNKETFTWSLANYVGSSPGRRIFPAEEVN